MAYEIPTPKYLRVLNALRQRIEDGVYGPGAALPSESQLCTEFGVSRPTVLKALGILKQDGWIESQQGKGSFVRGRPPSGRTSPEYARDVLELDETAEVEILHVGPVLASPRIAAELGIAEGTPVYERRRRTVSASGPVDLVATFVPVDIAVGTAVIKPEPIPGGLLDHIGRIKGLRADYATERMTARRVGPDEAEALEVPADEPVLSVVLTLHQASGEPILTSVLVMPGSRHEIEDTYPVS
ncbi:GntR family transcriptional regulator [Solwaraspora sp. WMMD1047]|jgi:GntR family transcriptional regulator|uniref:GntR family transcriptional regulator n=1 Tax=Solwaraspora sp. WMMD1047 TaxID=3016102 RepID=UPI002416F844|nr:GntR family transcriptional regulator [Solwaraspora sp. WMMD1047]MDG4828266.1 GntR family transcriptional regulator [Solwaraspora sp. WMMD1047]